MRLNITFFIKSIAYCEFMLHINKAFIFFQFLKRVKISVQKQFKINYRKENPKMIYLRIAKNNTKKNDIL